MGLSEIETYLRGDSDCIVRRLLSHSEDIGSTFYHWYLARAYEAATDYAAKNNCVVATLADVIQLLIHAPWESEIHRHAYTSTTEENIGKTAGGVAVMITGHGPVLALSASAMRMHTAYKQKGFLDELTITKAEVQAALQGKTPSGRSVQVYESFNEFCDAAESGNLPREYLVITDFEIEKKLAGKSYGSLTDFKELQEDQRLIIRSGGPSAAQRFVHRLQKYTSVCNVTSLAAFGDPDKPKGCLVGIKQRAYGISYDDMVTYREEMDGPSWGHFVVMKSDVIKK